MFNYHKNKVIEREYSIIHRKSRNLYKMISIYIFKHDKQTDGPSKLNTGCSLIQGIFTKKYSSQSHFSRNFTHGIKDKINYEAASLLKKKDIARHN